METLATFLASKFAEKPLFGESGEKFQKNKQNLLQESPRIAKVAILPFGRGLVLRTKRCRAR